MKDNDIKKKIDESLSNYQIKTTSNDILNAYYSSEEEVKKPKHNFTMFKFALPTLAIAMALAAIIILPATKTAIDPNFNESNNKQNQTAFSLFSGMSIVSGLGENSNNVMNLNLKKKLANNMATPYEDDDDDEEEEHNQHSTLVVSFENMMEAFNPSVDVINSLLETSINVDSTLSKGEFIGQFGTYPYKLEVYDYILYTNITLDEEDDEEETETVYQGEVIMSETLSYQVELNIEEEIDDGEKEQEIAMKIIYSDTSYLKIEQEIELDERSYKYTMYENDKKTYQQKISFEDEKKRNDFIDVEILKDQVKYVYDHIEKNDELLKGTYYLDENEDDKQNFTMKEEEGNRVYTNSKNEKVVIKK